LAAAEALTFRFATSTARHVRSDEGKEAQVKIWKEMHDILYKINPKTAVIVDGQ
jgi:hypothetical protein